MKHTYLKDLQGLMRQRWANGFAFSLVSAVFVVFFLFTSVVIEAQVKEGPFSEDPVEFLEELKLFFEKTPRKEYKKLLKSLDEMIIVGAMDDAQFRPICHFVNEMKARKMYAYPYYLHFFETLISIQAISEGPQLVKPWLEANEVILASITNKRYTKVDKFFDFVKEFYSSKKLVNSKAGASWFVNSNRPKYEFNEEGDVMLSFEKVDISASRKLDSLVILNTTGSFRVTDKHWIGIGGKINWWRYKQEEVYCTLDSFDIDMKRPLFEIENVSFVHPKLFPGQELKGKLSEKAYSADEDGLGNYPKFDGYDSGIKLDKLISDIELNGAFSLHGTTIYCAKSKGSAASFVVRNKSNVIRFSAKADRFKVSPGRIYSKAARVVLPIGKRDSITHPSVAVDYKTESQSLKLAKGEGLQAGSPYFDSYHGYDFSASDLLYNITGDSILIGKRSIGLGKVRSEIFFESPQFFKQSEYLRVQNIASVNPIARLNQMVEERNERVLDLASVIDAVNPKLNKQSIQSLMVDLVSMGFVEYNYSQDLVTVKDKTLHYAEAANQNTDYDSFKIESDSKNENGTLSLDNMDLLLSGVKKVTFSDSQKVAILPFFDEITLQKKNKLKMHGKLYAGYSTLEGLDFFYDYDQHKIQLDSVKYFQIYIPTGNKINGGEDEATAINSRIESMTAVLRVDAPHNKASLFNIPIFPSLHSQGKSYVYYDENAIQKGKYTRDSFYFQLDEFDMDGLDDLDSKEIVFQGEFESKDIMERFRDSLILRDDNSLGMIAETPQEGYSLYREKGNYIGVVDLSNKGLYGQGQLTYQKAVVNSDDILFLPYQLLASADEFNLDGVNEANNELPKVKGIDVKLNWKPYQDSMYIKSEEAPFQMFEKGMHQFKGELIYTPGGLKGNGLLDWSKGAVKSKLLSFGYDNTQGDTMTLSIKAASGSNLAFNSLNLNGDLDFEKNYGKFIGNSDDVNTHMPANQFKTNFNDFDWDINNSVVIFKDMLGGNGVFISTHPDMDSLDIIGDRARYDLMTNELEIKGVVDVRVADALVYPVDSTVVVREFAAIDTLYNATIIADTISRYHVINRAKVALKGKKDYRASGYYQYNIAGKEQEVLFDNIVGARVGKGKRSQKRTETRASGNVEQEDDFYIDHKTQFQGIIRLKSQQEALEFQGFARFDMEGLVNDSAWFSVNFIGDKNDLKLAYDTPKTPEGDPVETGLFLNKESAFLYPAIMYPLYSRQDRAIIDMEGIIDYDPKKDKLYMGDSAVVLGNARRGNSMTLQSTAGGLSIQGKMNICDKTDHVNVESYGIVKTRDSKIVYDSLGFATTEAEIKIEMLAGIQFYIPGVLKKHIVKELSESLTSALDAKYSDIFYDNVAVNFIREDKDLPKFSESLLLNRMTVPDKYNEFDFLFGRMEMKWIPDYQSFVSMKKNNPLISLDQLGIHKKLESYIEFKMPSNGDDRVYLYLKLPNGNYYFFGMKEGVLYTISNNGVYNEKVMNLKKKERKIKIAKGVELEVILSEEGTAGRFISRIKNMQ